MTELLKPGCICAHAPEHHGPDGCQGNRSRLQLRPRCPCNWDGVDPIGGVARTPASEPCGECGLTGGMHRAGPFPCTRGGQEAQTAREAASATGEDLEKKLVEARANYWRWAAAGTRVHEIFEEYLRAFLAVWLSDAPSRSKIVRDFLRDSEATHLVCADDASKGGSTQHEAHPAMRMARAAIEAEESAKRSAVNPTPGAGPAPVIGPSGPMQETVASLGKRGIQISGRDITGDMQVTFGRALEPAKCEECSGTGTIPGDCGDSPNEWRAIAHAIADKNAEIARLTSDVTLYREHAASGWSRAEALAKEVIELASRARQAPTPPDRPGRESK
jgi:hypothetical protein